jgi:hypothetical protein
MAKKTAKKHKQAKQRSNIMATLKELASSISYDSSWGIWAELIDGKFTADSQARYGQRQFENGGVLDGFEFFADGQKIVDNASDFAGDNDLHLSSQWSEVVRAFEADHDCEYGGNRRKVEAWAKESEIPEVVALIEASQKDFDNAFDSDEWLNAYLEEVNEALANRIEY